MIRTVLADDEPLALERLRQLVRLHPDVQVIAECVDGLETVDAIRTGEPDLVVLDVRMPELNAFGVIEEIGAESFPDVVFVTAFDQYAVRAFEAGALDYLLKPVESARFSLAMERVRGRQAGGERLEATRRLRSLIDDARQEHEYRQRLLVRKGERMVPVRLDEVDWISSAGNYLELHVGKTVHLVRSSLTELESELDPRAFLRIHRSTIVNVDRIAELHRRFAGDHVVTLRDGTRLSSSRTYRAKVREFAGRRRGRAGSKVTSVRSSPRN